MANLEKISKKLGVKKEDLERLVNKKKDLKKREFEKRESFFKKVKREIEYKRELIIIFVLIILGAICMGKALSFNKEQFEKMKKIEITKMENLEKRVNDLEFSIREYRMEEGKIYSQIKISEEYIKRLIKVETENKDIPELKKNYLKPISKNVNEDSLKTLEGTETNKTTGMYSLEINEDNGYKIDSETYIEKLKEKNKMLNMSNEERFEEIKKQIEKIIGR